MQAETQSSNVAHDISWDCLQALEEALAKTNDVVEIHRKNYQVVSAQYKAIIVNACDEIRNVYQRVCGQLLEAKADIGHYIETITHHHADFFNSEITMPAHDEVLKPWSACATGKDPAFWTAYNKIKQTDALENGALENSTLEHAIYSMAALFALLLVWH